MTRVVAFLIVLSLVGVLVLGGCGGGGKAPTVTKVTPSSGKVGETIDLTITGTDFGGATAVDFGSGITVDTFNAASETSITARITIAADATTGPRTVTVTTPDGTGSKSAAFTVSGLQAATVTAVSPDSAEEGETLDVTITGTNFTDASDVSFGADVTVNNFNVVSDTQISASITIEALPAQTPIKIGSLWTFTGPIGPTGTEASRGIEIFLDEVGGQIMVDAETTDVSVTNEDGVGTLSDGFALKAPREIQVLPEDVAADAATGLEKATKLVEHDNVDLLMGLVNSAVGIAIRDYVDQNHVPLFITGMCGAQVLSFEMKSDYILRTSQINGLHSFAVANYAYDELGYRTFVLMAEDYAAGHEYANVFKGVVESKGGEVVQEIYTPYGEVDYSAYLTQVQDADAVFGFYNVFDALNFVNQYAEYGLWDRMPLLGVAGLVTPPIMAGEGDNIIDIVMAGHSAPFGAWSDRPAYVDFTDTFRDRYGDEAGDIAVNAYNGMQVIYRALQAVNGNVEDGLALLDAAKQLHFDALYSPISFDVGTNSVVVDVRVYRIEKEGGQMGFSILRTYEGLGPEDIAPYRQG